MTSAGMGKKGGLCACKTYKLLELINWISLGLFKLNLTCTIYGKRDQKKENHIWHIFFCVFLLGKAWKVASPFMENYMPHWDLELMETMP